MLWKSRDGTVTDIREMSDSHLENTTKMLAHKLAAVRKQESAMWSMMSVLHGEMAIDAAESECDRLSEAGFDLEGMLIEFKQERKRRDADR